MVHRSLTFIRYLYIFFTPCDLSQSSTKSFRFQNMKQDFSVYSSEEMRIISKILLFETFFLGIIPSNFYERNHIKVTLYHAILNSLQVSLVFFHNSFRSLFSHPHRRSLMFSASSSIFNHLSTPLIDESRFSSLSTSWMSIYVFYSALAWNWYFMCVCREISIFLVFLIKRKRWRWDLNVRWLTFISIRRSRSISDNNWIV